MFAKIKKNYFFLVFVFFLIYFLFNLFSGERGLISFIDKKRTLFELEKQENYLKKRNDDLELKNSLLSSNMDLDFIDVLIRQKFLFGKKNETTYIYNENGKQN